MPDNLVPQQSSSVSQSTGYNQATNQATNQSTSNAVSSSYIPEYSQTPILQGIAQYAGNMAPEVYNWGMQQFNRNQGNIDQMMRDAKSYASPERVEQEMGQAQAGVMQGAEAGRQNAVRDLQGYGIDPSSGRYAALDQASRVQAGAAAAGAGNQQRMATQAQGTAMQNQALAAGMQNTQLGYGASNAMNQLLGTGMQLNYSPLGQQSVSSQQSSGQSSGQSTGTQQSQSSSGTGGGSGLVNYAEGGEVDDDATTGGFVSHELSPTNGSQIDDVKANLNAGEFVIPKDIVEWKGQEFFYKLMAQARKMRATSGGEQNGMGGGEPTGYAQSSSVAPHVGNYAGGGTMGGKPVRSSQDIYADASNFEQSGQLKPQAAWELHALPDEERQRLGMKGPMGNVYTDFEKRLMPRVSAPGGGKGEHWTDTATGTRLIDRYAEGGPVASGQGLLEADLKSNDWVRRPQAVQKVFADQMAIMGPDGRPMLTEFGRRHGLVYASAPGGGSGSHWVDTTTGSRLLDQPMTVQQGDATRQTRRHLAGGDYQQGGSVAPQSQRFTDAQGYAPPMTFGPQPVQPSGQSNGQTSGQPQNLAQLMAQMQANPAQQPLTAQPPPAAAAQPAMQTSMAQWQQLSPSQQRQVRLRDTYTEVMALPEPQRSWAIARYQNNPFGN